MNRKSWTLIAAAVVLGAWYVYSFSDFGRHRPIQITVASRPFAPNASPGDVLPLVFGLDSDRALTEISVFLPTTNNGSAPDILWKLQSKKGSTPVRGFLYGEAIGGMESVGTTAPKPLQPGVTYRVEVAEGRSRGGLDFVPRPAVTE